jgi:pyruvate dehydrogenase E2 component (dihydrolipoamide acetyltransferase)
MWNVKVGDRIDPGDVLCGVETDKATVDFEMQEEGYVAALLYPEGAKDVPLGEIIAILVEEKADVAAFANYKASSVVSESTPAADVPIHTASKPASLKKSYPDHVLLEMPNLSPTMEKVSLFSLRHVCY